MRRTCCLCVCVSVCVCAVTTFESLFETSSLKEGADEEQQRQTQPTRSGGCRPSKAKEELSCRRSVDKFVLISSSPLGPITRFYPYLFFSDNCFVVLSVGRPL
jgi:hypothetical protein